MNEKLTEMIEVVDELIQRWRALGNPMMEGHYYVVTREENGVIVLAAPPGNKEESLALTRSMLAALDCVRYVYVDEAWRVLGDDDETIRRVDAHIEEHGTLESFPDVEDVVSYFAEDAGGGFMVATRTIARDGAVGPLVHDEEVTRVEGQMVGLLTPTGRAN